MNTLSQLKKITSLFVILIVLTCFALAQRAQAVSPAPDGGYPGGNTAEGQNALLGLTTGGFNTAIGFLSLRVNQVGSFNTGVGAEALFADTGQENTATGAGALFSNASGNFNTANGAFALFSNTMGHENTAAGDSTLFQNTLGMDNTACGYAALNTNTTSNENTGIGAYALALNTTGSSNTAMGYFALRNNVGNGNIALGTSAGQNLTTGDYNIDIGNEGFAGEANTIRIGDDAHQGSTFIAAVYGVAVSGLTVVMDSSDHLGTLGSSQRFKREIKAMDKASEAILALKPVTFRYKTEIDPAGTSQFGLVAEEVEKVNGDLVVRDKEGNPYSVRYEAVNTMLLNEFLKEHRKVQELESTLARQEATAAKQEAALAKQQKQIEALMGGLQKVTDQLALSKPALRTVLNYR